MTECAGCTYFDPVSEDCCRPTSIRGVCFVEAGCLIVTNEVPL